VFREYPRPHWINVGRVTPEKGLADFCALDLPGTKSIVGDGTARKFLERQFPTTVFLGEEHDRRKLARIIAGMDVFVFPSRSDTFGLVLIEANACGLPVAGYPDAIGPSEYIKDGKNGHKHADLREAALACLTMGKTASCREEALRRGWEKPARELFDTLVPLR
jgi:glycosyltransferase involved in cell wall biosynthesis